MVARLCTYGWLLSLWLVRNLIFFRKLRCWWWYGGAGPRFPGSAAAPPCVFPPQWKISPRPFSLRAGVRRRGGGAARVSGCQESAWSRASAVSWLSWPLLLLLPISPGPAPVLYAGWVGTVGVGPRTTLEGGYYDRKYGVWGIVRLGRYFTTFRLL